MRFRHNHPLPREQDAGGGAPAADAGKTTPAAPEKADGAAPAPPPDAGKADGGEQASIFDALDAPAKDADGKPTRPDWCPEPFWNAEKGEPMVEALAKSQADLRKQISRGDHKPPEKPDAYVLPKIEGLPEVPADDPLWTTVRAAAHEAGLSQAQLERVVKPYLEAARQRIPANADPAAAEAARRAAYAEEIAKLGPNGRAQAADIKGWIMGLESSGALSAEEARALLGVGNAAGVRALMKLRARGGGEQAIPIDVVDPGQASQADAQAMMVKGFADKDEAMVKRGRGILQKLEAEGRLRAP